MQFSSEFMQLCLKKEDGDTRDIQVSRLALASLLRKPEDEEHSHFEARQLASFELFKDQAALLEKASEASDLFPRLTTPAKIAHGTAEFEQAFEGTADPGRLSGGNLASIAQTIGEGLAELHKLGGVHLAIHPASLSFGFSGRVSLYGIGAEMRLLAAESDGYAAMGDAEFFPPELFDKTGKSKVGPWTDIYQLCATLYALSVGAPPPSFIARLKDNKTSFDLIQSRLKQDAELERSGLADAIISGLHLSRNQRPASLDEWLASFEHAAPEEPSVLSGLAAATIAAKEPETPEQPSDGAAFASLKSADDVLVREADGELEYKSEERHEKEEKSSGGFGFGKALALLLFAGVVFAGGFYANTLIMTPEMLAQGAGEDNAAPPPIEEEPEEPSQEEVPEEEPFAAQWLIGDWVIDQSENGCEARLIIQRGDAEDELRFINPDDDITGKDTFTQLTPNSVETNSWKYTLDGDTIAVVGVNDDSQTLTLSQCSALEDFNDLEAVE